MTRLTAAQRQMLHYMNVSDGTIEPKDAKEDKTAAQLLKLGLAQRCLCIVITPAGRDAPGR